MIPINALMEEVVTDMLRKTSPCGLDDLVRSLPNRSWGEVFVAVDRMSRDGRVLLRQVGYSTYQITIPSQLASTPLPARQDVTHPTQREISPDLGTASSNYQLTTPLSSC